MIDIDYLERHFRGCQVVEIPAFHVLYRGTFEREPNEYPDLNIITGVKTFAFDKSVALNYAHRDPKKNHAYKSPRDPVARSVLFTVTLLAKCRAFVWQDLKTHITAAQITDYWRFEREELFPIARRALGDPLIVGYVTNPDLSDAYEAVIDTSRAHLRAVAEIIA